jgi:hypothetical protein
VWEEFGHLFTKFVFALQFSSLENLHLLDRFISLLQLDLLDMLNYAVVA